MPSPLFLRKGKMGYGRLINVCLGYVQELQGLSHCYFHFHLISAAVNNFFHKGGIRLVLLNLFPEFGLLPFFADVEEGMLESGDFAAVDNLPHKGGIRLVLFRGSLRPRFRSALFFSSIEEGAAELDWCGCSSSSFVELATPTDEKPTVTATARAALDFRSWVKNIIFFLYSKLNLTFNLLFRIVMIYI